jgi:DNA-binding CsgD family transcriptional regulator
VQYRQVPLDLFVGRDAELVQVAEVVTRVGAGQPWLVAIEGDPGVGKTSMARRCLAQAPGLKVLAARADQAETDLDFGLVDQLLRAAGRIPQPVPLTSEADSAASSFAVGAHLLEVVGEQQASGTVAILVDDLQWADRRSVEALTFMLRRLSVDPVLAVVLYRGPSGRLAQARDDPDSQPLAATIAGRLAGTYALQGSGEKVMTLGRWALGTGRVTVAAASQLRALIAIGASQVAGPREALAELGHLDPDPARVGVVDVDGLSFRGVLRLQLGDLGQAMRDLTASLKLSRKGATLILGLRASCYLALAQYLAGQWDDVLLTSEQGFSAALIHSRRYELPMLHLAACSVPAGRGMTGEAERHARLAGEAVASLDYGQERLYAAMARALVGQAAGDYLGMADALGPWRDDTALDGRSRVYAMLWRPLLAEGLIGSGQAEQAAPVVSQLRAENGQVSYIQPALAWLEGWLAELRGAPEEALRVYQRGEEAAGTQSPVHTARLLLAHGQLLRRTGNRKEAVARLRRASDLYRTLRAAPFTARTEEELAACNLPGDPARKQPVLALTSRETEVAHLVGKGLSNPEIAAELFISRKAVEYHLGNIYAKCGLRGRQQLRRFVGQWRQPATV